MLVTAVALFFSTFSSPMLSALFTFGLFVVGHFNADLRNFEAVSPRAAVGAVARALLLPAAEHGGVRREDGGRARAAGARPATCAERRATAALYIGALLLAAIAIFSRRDFK